MRLRYASILGLCVVGASSAHATFFFNATGLNNPATTITFDEHVFGNGTQLTNEYAAEGVLFSPHLFFNPQGPETFPGISGNNIGNGTDGTNPYSILFTSTQTAAAFGFATNPLTATFTAKLNGTTVDSGSLATTFNDPTQGFIGFTGVTFDEIEIDLGGQAASLVDNIQLGAVPEPATMAILGMGALALLRKKRRA